jgi:hypothetical protein
MILWQVARSLLSDLLYTTLEIEKILINFNHQPSTNM